MSIEYLITHVQGESNILLESNEILGSSLRLDFDESLHNYKMQDTTKLYAYAYYTISSNKFFTSHIYYSEN